MKSTTPISDRIINSVLYGDPRGYGYSHPTPREKFEASKMQDSHDCKLADKGFCECVKSHE